MKVTVLVVEDDPITADRLAANISAYSNFSLLGVRHDLQSAKQAVAEYVPNIVLVDLGLPDGSGLDLISFIGREEIESKPMVVSVFEDNQNIIKAIHAGACGYILKDDTTIEIADAINIVQQGGAPISPVIAKHVLDIFNAEGGSTGNTDEPLQGLTGREKDILLGVCKGYTNKEIASQEYISYHTVTTHIKHIYRKLKVRSRVEATHLGISAGILDPREER